MVKIFETISAWHRLFRSEHALITFLGVLVGAMLGIRDFRIPIDAFSVNSIAGLDLPFFLWIIVAAIGPALITLAAFALNDYFGYETDRANKRKDRPIVAGEIKRQHALYAALVLFAVGLYLTYLVNFTVFALSAVYVALCFLYDNFLKKLPLAGNAFIALTMSGPFIYGSLTVSTGVSPVVALLAAIAFLVGLGRELLNTLRDIEGDKKIGASTLPMLLGGKNTAILSSLLIISAVLLSLLPFFGSYLRAPFFYAVFLIPCNVLLLLTVYKALKSQDNLSLKQARNYTLAALGCGVLAFLSLAVM